MATRRYKSKKQLSKKHGKKSKNHKKRVKKTRKYRKKSSGGMGDDDSVPQHENISEVDKKYVPRYDYIMELLDEIKKGNEARKTDIFDLNNGDQTISMTPTTELNKWLINYKNPVSCGFRRIMGDFQNCNTRKKKVYRIIRNKIGVITKEIEKKEGSSLLGGQKVSNILEVLKKAHNNFLTKMVKHH